MKSKKLLLLTVSWFLLSTLYSLLSTLSFAQPPRVKYRDRFTVERSTFAKSAPGISQEKLKPEIKITLIPKKLSPQFSEFQGEGEITNAEITRVSFHLFGKVVGMVGLEIKEIDFTTEGLEQNAVFYHGYDIRCSFAGIKGCKVYFRVSKRWLAENNVFPEKISLRSYVKGEITALATEKVGEDDSYVYLLGESERLGIFLIFAEK